MFIGHYAVGFASKRFAPQASLGVLMAAPILLDLLWPIFLLLGWERVRIDPGNTAFTPLDFISYPISHSLLAAAGWATLFALVYYAVSRYAVGAIAIWTGVVSHWVLDFLTHRPDLPLYPGGPKFGLGLWYSPAATIVIEGLMFAAGVFVYARATRRKDAIGAWGFRLFVIGLAAIYVMNIVGPPPPGVTALAIGAFCLSVVMVLWAWWFDRHRADRTS